MVAAGLDGPDESRIMLFSFRKKDPQEGGVVDWAEAAKRCEERREFFLLAARTLVQCLREYALDIEELNSARFKADLVDLAETLGSDEKISRLQARFRRDTDGIDAFARRQKNYLHDRETEYKEIVSILSKAMATLDFENQEYNRSILAQSRRLEEITFLDDIKRIKQVLLQEVEQLQAAVRQKELRDVAKIEKLALQVSALNNELQAARTESERDSLTGVYNRRAFDRRLADLMTRNTLQVQPFALLMIDIDDFKRINDSYGHPTGDRVLVTLVNKCRQSVRGEDLLARYGGEEFAILLLGASLRNAVKKARQICESIGSARYLLEGMPACEPLGITVSIGVSAWCSGDTAADLVGRADKALYLAKGAGKNRVLSEKDIK
jgi:diguanylate cyclase